ELLAPEKFMLQNIDHKFSPVPMAGDFVDFSGHLGRDGNHCSRVPHKACSQYVTLRRTDSAGRVLWTYSHRNPERTYNCCGRVNRGLAILDNRLFMNKLDMRLIALDAKSGRELWKTEIHD